MGFLLTLIIFAVLLLLSELLKPKPKNENAKPAGLGDFNFPTATEGRAVPLVWGTVQLTGPNVIWYGDLHADPIKQRVQTSLFSSKKVIIGYKYRVGMQLGLCMGDVQELRRIWVGDDLLWDGTAAPLEHTDTLFINQPAFFGGDDVGGNGGIVATLQFFSGKTDQIVSPYLTGFQSISGDTPGYRGVCYIAPSGGAWNLGNSTSIKPWKLEVRRLPATLPGQSSAHEGVNGGADANPIFVLYEALTNTDWGLGFAADKIDVASFMDAAEVCFDEGNGFSMVLDNQMEVSEFIRLIEEQVDCLVYQSQITGQWKIALIRPEDQLPSPPPDPREVTASNLLKLEAFARGAWDNTTNQVLVEFHDREDGYKLTYAGAQDMANIEIQGVNIRNQMRFPGVKAKALANNLAWRELLTLSYPLAKATLIVDRTFWDMEIGSRISLTDEDLGIEEMVMRIVSVNLGKLAEGQVRLDVVEDIFANQAGVFSDPPATGWETPADTLQAFLFEKAFEAPRAFTRRNTGEGASQDDVRVWAGARVRGPENAFEMHERHGATNPSSGAYELVGVVYGFVLVGKLLGALAKSTAVPGSANIDLEPVPDTAAAMLAALDVTLTKNQVGQQLANLLMIDNEFILVVGAIISGSNLRLNDYYRGALDSIQEDHADDAPVYILSAGGGISDVTFPSTHHMDVKLLPTSFLGTLPIASAADIEFQNAKRARRPYAPVWFKLAGTILNYPSTLSLEQTGSTEDNFGLAFEVRRRDYRTEDEVTHMEADAATLVTDFPSAQSHVTKVEVRKDPAGSPVLLFTDTESVTAWTLFRKKVLRFNAGAVPANLGLTIFSEHVDSGEVLSSRRSYTVNFALTSALTTLFNMGIHAAAVATPNPFVVAANGVHSALIVTALVSNLEYRINGGAWATLIAAGATSGSTAALTIADTVEFRHAEVVAGLIQIVKLRNPSAVHVAYSVLYV